MTNFEKELLLKDLCARLPHRVKVESIFIDLDTKEHILCGIEVLDATSLLMIRDELGEFKPYLFPLSNMTEEQKVIYGDLCYAIIHSLAWDMQAALNELVDWLNKNHFDFRDLIQMGLAIDATGLDIY